MAKLTERQRRFAEHYMACGIAEKAAKLAGYKCPHPEGLRLLRNATVKEEIARLAKAKSNSIGVSRAAKKERLQNIIEGEDDKLAMAAIDIDNKMEAEYVQRIKDETPQMTEAEADEMYLEEMRAKRLEYGVCPVCGTECARN